LRKPVLVESLLGLRRVVGGGCPGVAGGVELAFEEAARRRLGLLDEASAGRGDEDAVERW